MGMVIVVFENVHKGVVFQDVDDVAIKTYLLVLVDQLALIVLLC